MASSSVSVSLKNLIRRKGFAVAKWTARSYASSSWSYQMSTRTIHSSPPWLMLPPAGVNMSYKFYCLAENKVVTLSGSREKELTDVMPKPKQHHMYRGSSHGWLALFNPRNLDLFLYNPISQRHIKLPPIHDLPNFPQHNSRGVVKVILSCSPDEDSESCRAVMIHNCTHLLAFCCPEHSKEWTSIGDTHYWDEDKGKRLPRGYEDCVYSAGQEVLYALTNCGDLETWDLVDASKPRMIRISNVDDDKHLDFSETEEEEEKGLLQYLYVPREHLVVADDDLLIVTQYIMEYVGPDGSYVDHFDEGCENCPHVTVDFDIHKCDPEEGDLTYVEDNSSLALFIGFYSHAVALPAAQFPGLKPNSIYFTDAIETGSWRGEDDDTPFGGHDIGIFNYQDRTVSSCYYPCDVQRLKKILPAPMWFFPSSPI